MPPKGVQAGCASLCKVEILVSYCRMFRLLLSLILIGLTASSQPSRIVRKIVGETHKLVLFSDGSAGGWGDMRDGQLGPRAAIPNSSGHASVYVPIALPGKVIDIAAGARTSYFLLETGAVFSMGWGMNGELGCGEGCTNAVETPVAVAGLRDAIQIEASGAAAFAVHRDGSVSAWGSRASGMLGDNLDPKNGDVPTRALTPIRVPGVTGVVQLSAGGGHVLARTSNGRVLAWGKLPFGIVYFDDPVELPHEVPGLSGVVSVAAAGVAAALKSDGTVWVWGKNTQAQFGNGRRTDDDRTRTPIPVPRVANVTAISSALTGRHILALQKTGTVVAWGNTDWGQGGVGITGKEQATPATLKLTGVKSVFAAGNNSFAVREDGSLWIWGLGSSYPNVWPMRKNSALPIRLEIPGGIAVP